MNLKDIRSRFENNPLKESALSPETLDDIIHIVHEQMNKEEMDESKTKSREVNP